MRNGIACALTPRALNLLARQESLGFYDDVVPMLRRETVESLFLILRDSEQPYASAK
jgi:hypothetical protein